MQELDNILYSDEASFYLNGSINKQNNRRYAPLKKHDPVQGGRPANFVHEKPTYDPHIMVFCGLKRDGVFGLKIYHQGTMTGDRYHSLLQYTVLPDIRTWNGGNLDNLYWSQDGAPAHTTRRNLAYLHQNFGNRVISRGAINGINWPARSPDLNPCDFFLWGFLKDRVYSPKPQNLLQLEQNIRREVASIPAPMATKVIRSMRTRAQLCLASRGGYFEVYVT